MYLGLADILKIEVVCMYSYEIYLFLPAYQLTDYVKQTACHHIASEQQEVVAVCE